MSNIRETLAKKFVIGAASWGSEYGLFNQRAADRLDAEAILKIAGASGISAIDTAPTYGDSESIIGQCSIPNLEIYTKLGMGLWERGDENAYQQFLISLHRLGVSNVKGLTFHSAGTFLKDPQRGLMLVKRLIYEGLIDEWGVSVYEPDEIDEIIEISTPNYIQAPVSVFDRRFVSRDFRNKFSESNLKLQARSIFLQGLAINDFTDVPKYFSRWEPLLQMHSDAAKSLGISKMQLALLSIICDESIDTSVVGVNNLVQMTDLIDCLLSDVDLADFEAYPNSDDLDFIDPRRWPTLK